MAEMAGTTTNCARFREQMLDAASAALSGGVRAAFDAHLHHCAACREEFGRVQTFVQKIDQTLSVSLTAEPSARLVANVRRNILEDINGQAHRAETWMRWSKWATATGVCAAFAVLLFVARTSRKFNRPIHHSGVVHSSAPPILKPAVHPRLNANIEVAVTQPRKPPLGLARHASLRTFHAKAAEPEIIVQPGQMRAILQLVAETQRGQIDGSNLLNSEKKAAEPLEIKPLVIAPLKISASDDELEPSTSNSGLDRSKSPLSSRSN